MLYDSLHEKLLKLPDATKVYPAHGAGSLCGRNISSETSSTIGEQRRFNYALQPMSREEFVKLVTADLPEAPAYFARDVAINREGAAARSRSCPPPPALSPDEVGARARTAAPSCSTRARRPHTATGARAGLAAHRAVGPVRFLGGLARAARGARSCSSRRTRSGGARPGCAWRAWALENVSGYLAGGIRAWDASGRPLAPTEQIDGGRARGAARASADAVSSARRAPARGVEGRPHRGSAACMPLDRLRRAREDARPGAPARRRSAPAATARRSRRACSSGRGSEGHQRRRRHGGVERAKRGPRHRRRRDEERHRGRCGGAPSALCRERPAAQEPKEVRAASGKTASRPGCGLPAARTRQVFSFAEDYKAATCRRAHGADVDARSHRAWREGGRVLRVQGRRRR